MLELLMSFKLTNSIPLELLYAISQSLQQEKTGILGNCVLATFSKNIKQLTYAGCQSEIPLDSV